MTIGFFKYLNNHKLIFLANGARRLGKGKYFRKKLYSIQRILELNYPEQSEFNFMQIGANDGISFDGLYHFVTKRKSSGLVIEPIKEYFDELCNNYSDYNSIIKMNMAVHKSEKSISIYKMDSSKISLYPKWVKGIASFNIKNLTKFGFIKPEHIIKEQVTAMHLMEVIKESGYCTFDYLQVDTEGYDFEVIDMLDFKKVSPKIIKAEYVNLSVQEKKMIWDKFRRNGYFTFRQGLDLIGVNLRKVVI